MMRRHRCKERGKAKERAIERCDERLNDCRSTRATPTKLMEGKLEAKQKEGFQVKGLNIFHVFIPSCRFSISFFFPPFFLPFPPLVFGRKRFMIDSLLNLKPFCSVLGSSTFCGFSPFGHITRCYADDGLACPSVRLSLHAVLF